jgi:hypothetical protein
VRRSCRKRVLRREHKAGLGGGSLREDWEKFKRGDEN